MAARFGLARGILHTLGCSLQLPSPIHYVLYHLLETGETVTRCQGLELGSRLDLILAILLG